VQWQEHPYAGAQIRAIAYNDQQQSFPVTVIQDGQGSFTIQFVAPASGHYRIVFTTGGSYKDSHGDFGQTVRDVNVTVVPPTSRQLAIALGVTGFYIILLIFLIFLVKFWLTPKPFGEWIYDPGGENTSGQRFNRAHRGPFQWFFRRNILTSHQAYMPSGLILRFNWGKQIEACSDGSPRAKDWHFSDGRPLRQTFQRVRELGFTMGDGEDGEGVARYLILPGDRGSSRSTRGSDGPGSSNIDNGRYPRSSRGGPKSPRPTGRGKKPSSKPSGRGKSNTPSWKDYYNV
jgi:hypothetical protein